MFDNGSNQIELNNIHQFSFSKAPNNRSHMALATTFWPIFKLFQLFYLSSSALANSSRCAIFFRSIFGLIIFVLWQCSVLHILWKFWTDHKQFVYVVSIIIISIVYCVIIIETITYHDQQIEILSAMSNVDEFLMMDIRVVTTIKRKYLTKVYCSFMFVVICEIIAIITVYRASVFEWNIFGLYFPKIAICLRLMQIGFYVDMVYERLRQVMWLLESVQNERDNVRILNFLYLTREAYGKLWTICYEINKAFGCSLAVINVEFMFDLIADVHLIYNHFGRSTELTVGKCVIHKKIKQF